MKVSQVLNCSFERWYPLFQSLTFKSEIIPLPDNVLEYLRSDSTIILPKSCQEELELERKNRKEDQKKNFDDSDDSWDEDEENDNESKKSYPDFDEFDKILKKTLKNFSNKVFIKLNWSSPKDAYWCLSKLSCERLSDIYMLLRSSDFINHDLNEPFEECSDKEEMKSVISNFKYFLIVREWISLNPSMEFRCFVNKNKLIGISQRECRSFYQTLLDNKQDLLNRIEKFYIENIYNKFFDESFVFDVCLGKKTVKLLDFNPFGKLTDSLLYSWEELVDESLLIDSNEFKSNKLELRIVESDIGVQSNQYSMYSQPKDALDINELDTSDLEALPSIIQKNIELQNKDEGLSS